MLFINGLLAFRRIKGIIIIKERLTKDKEDNNN